MPIKWLKCLFSSLAVSMLSLPAFANEWEELMGNVAPIVIDEQRKSAPTKANKPNKLQMVKRLDQEILVLRAEMSKRHGDVRQVERYLKQLDKQSILPPFVGRIETLKQWAASQSSFFRPSRYVQKLEFPIDDATAVVALVLPTSGPYEIAGQVLHDTLQNELLKAGFKGKLISLDSNLYNSAYQLWEILKFYEPDFIFGPLTKDMVQQWKELKTGVTTLFFNDTGYLGVGEFSLSPSRQAGLEQVFQLLQQGHYSSVMVLRDNSESSVELEQSFQQAWMSINPLNTYQLAIIEGNVGQAIDQAMGVERSVERERWLQRVLGQRLEFETRTRQDFEAIISFVPQRLAIQISPYLHYLSEKNEITHIWYPSANPTANFIAFNKESWQQTFAILPQSILINTERKNQQIDIQNKSGLFYALAKVAVEIVKNSTLSNTATAVDTVEFSQYGSYVRNASGQFHLLPVVYWADQGVFEKFYQTVE